MKMRMNQNGSAAYSAGQFSGHRFSSDHRGAPSIIGALLSDATAMINVWRWRRPDRRAIRQLDDHMLRDIGIDRFAAEQIGARTHWEA